MVCIIQANYKHRRRRRGRETGWATAPCLEVIRANLKIFGKPENEPENLENLKTFFGFWRSN